MQEMQSYYTATTAGVTSGGGVGGFWANSPLLLMAFGMMGTPSGWAESIYSGSQVTPVYVGFLVDCYQRGFFTRSWVPLGLPLPGVKWARLTTCAPTPGLLAAAGFLLPRPGVARNRFGRRVGTYSWLAYAGFLGLFHISSFHTIFIIHFCWGGIGLGVGPYFVDALIVYLSSFSSSSWW